MVALQFAVMQPKLHLSPQSILRIGRVEQSVKGLSELLLGLSELSWWIKSDGKIRPIFPPAVDLVGRFTQRGGRKCSGQTTG